MPIKLNNTSSKRAILSHFQIISFEKLEHRTEAVSTASTTLNSFSCKRNGDDSVATQMLHRSNQLCIPIRLVKLKLAAFLKIYALFVWLISHQPAVLFLSEQTSHQQPANSTFLSEQISTSHQSPAKRTCC
jgi:hypothetical protein